MINVLHSALVIELLLAPSIALMTEQRTRQDRSTSLHLFLSFIIVSFLRGYFRSPLMAVRSTNQLPATAVFQSTSDKKTSRREAEVYAGAVRIDAPSPRSKVLSEM